MLDLSEIDLSISTRLQPLRDILENSGLLVAALPKEAGAYSSSESGGISVMVPQVTGTQPSQEGIQEVTILVVIRLVLPKRYQDDDTEVNVVEFVADKIIQLLLGFTPFAGCGRSLWLQSYDLLEPSGGQWEAELRFQCIKALVYPIPYPDDDTQVENVQLFASETLSQLDAILVTQIPPDI
ncbi:MAG: Gp37 family protein [Iphinoe sp. HA4291-MV1]|jgi:hypothetical protein|nr:Gp37 family protein [Iphinoe sp. HA4291-MV1]